MSDPIALGQTKEFVTETDLAKPEGQRTTWILGALDSYQEAKIQLNLTSSIKTPPKNAEEAKKMADTPITKEETEFFMLHDFWTVRYGLKGFKNFGKIEFATEKEKAFNHEYDVVPEAILLKIQYNDIVQISNAIWEMNKVSEELAKN